MSWGGVCGWNVHWVECTAVKRRWGGMYQCYPSMEEIVMRLLVLVSYVREMKCQWSEKWQWLLSMGWIVPGLKIPLVECTGVKSPGVICLWDQVPMGWSLLGLNIRGVQFTWVKCPRGQMCRGQLSWVECPWC